MNLLVTGGAGFIGSNFIRNCFELSGSKIQSLVNIDLLTYCSNLSRLEAVEHDSRYFFIRLDIAAEEIQNLLNHHEIDAVVHFAAETHVDRSIDTPKIFFQTNVLGTLSLLNSCVGYWKSLRGQKKTGFRFLHVSTDEVYGSLGPNGLSFTETTPYSPNNPYAASKASSDFAVRSFHKTYQLPVLITHSSNNYGPFQFPEKLVPFTINNALEERDLLLYGDGQNIRDWIHVDDHCRALIAVLRNGELGETYNIGGAFEISNFSLVSTICANLDMLKPRACGRSYHDLIKFVADRPGHDFRYSIDSQKIRNRLGWRPEIMFEDGIRRTIDWHLN